jgi:hypothetical protein
MPVTTLEFEEHLNCLLTRMENWKRCEWCGCQEDQRRIGARSKLCDRCKKWRRKEQLALEWQRNNADLVGKEAGFYYEYCVQFANLCREEGAIHSWKGPIASLELETELEFLTEQFFGEKGKIGGTILTFGQFSDAQRRLLMYLFQRMHNVWLQHRRHDFAWEKIREKLNLRV